MATCSKSVNQTHPAALGAVLLEVSAGLLRYVPHYNPFEILSHSPAGVLDPLARTYLDTPGDSHSGIHPDTRDGIPVLLVPRSCSVCLLLVGCSVPFVFF